jgi:hypothetical protein
MPSEESCAVDYPAKMLVQLTTTVVLMGIQRQAN